MLIQTEKIQGVVILRLHRPSKRNALCTALMQEMVTTLTQYDNDPDVGCFILTGSEQVFAAGADISEMADMSYQEMTATDYFAGWEAISRIRTPIVAAVAGYALGGGCELAMMCDTIFAAESALFGQPELTIGVIPGMGGSQRLTHLVGKSKAIDMILTGRMMDAVEAERAGLVSRVVPDDQLMHETLEAAKTIASYSKPAVMLAKECVLNAETLSVEAGVKYERRAFHGLFATEDQKEGMHAFIEKRKPHFTGH
ncbi:enoyl-CoA hydratase-related protein [Enterovibrio sp. ZSDZ35]|uniref:Enoyl-CoA hydratase-related protein n=1 Tax=Enterovibrio qingdaonensis TaxID=2899818 RepID=A0ABT5QH61_9GAMM|nr:enoyl-CoA hydratase-related protein [Enterovibrio sp. ZSDZ35]MDD1780048.1 enoyl-CoA hydratase-related protein [Enterovibrio sp. ZSDZ35]